MKQPQRLSLARSKCCVAPQRLFALVLSLQFESFSLCPSLAQLLAGMALLLYSRPSRTTTSSPTFNALLARHIRRSGTFCYFGIHGIWLHRHTNTRAVKTPPPPPVHRIKIERKSVGRSSAALSTPNFTNRRRDSEGGRVTQQQRAR